MSFSPSPQQTAIFQDVESGEGHTVCLARAGSGKTTTIMKALDHVPARDRKSILLVAFNTSIKKELAARAPKGVAVMTTHGYGLRQLSALRPRVNPDKGANIALEVCGDGREKAELRAVTRKLVGLAKANLLRKPDSIQELFTTYGLDAPKDVSEERVSELASQCIARSLEDQDNVDFDDMIFFPNVLKLGAPDQYARPFVDEMQDLNKAQLRMMANAVAPGGRLTGVGDDRQAIYSFRGAADDAVSRIVEKLQAKTLKLTVSYRCSKAIAREAARVVPDFEAAPNAEEGTVAEASMSALLRGVQSTDFVLSRSNAPLVRVCFKLMAEGRRVSIAGRDIGARLSGIVRRARANDLTQLKTRVEHWAAQEVARYEKKDRDPSTIYDCLEAINAVIDVSSSVEDVERRIDAVFSDDPAGGGRIVLSSTHKAKGLETDRVWLLRDTYLRSRPRKCPDCSGKGCGACSGKGKVWVPPGIEEYNLLYVATTRARKVLNYVASESGGE